MNTELLIKWRPVRFKIVPVSTPGGTIINPSVSNNYNLRSFDNSNIRNDQGYLKTGNLVSMDLEGQIDIPVNFTIFDISEPDKRKTNWTKTIILPGTPKNNKIFNHSYEISGVSMYNPNKRLEVIIRQGGVQLMRGNMRLLDILIDDGSLKYEVVISGDLTSIFTDMGDAKLADLDFSEYRHDWNRTSIVNSWNGQIKKNEQVYTNIIQGTQYAFISISPDTTTGRMFIETTYSHDFAVGDVVRVVGDEDSGNMTIEAELVSGDFTVTEVVSNLEFVVNHPFSPSMGGVIGYVQKWESTGKGYVYPMISCGLDSFDPWGNPMFPITSFTMAFFVKEIIDKIFEKTNSRYESDFFNSTAFKRYIISNKKTQYEFANTSDDFHNREFNVANYTGWTMSICGTGLSQSDFVSGINTGGVSTTKCFPYNTTNMQPYPFGVALPGTYNELYNGLPGNEPFNQSTNKWVCTDSGRYNLNFKIMMDSTVEISDYTAAGVYKPPVNNPGNGLGKKNYFFGGASSNGVPSAINEHINITARVVRLSNGVTTILDSKMISNFDILVFQDQAIRDSFKKWRWPIVATTWAPGVPASAFEVVFTEQFINKGDTVWIEILVESIVNNPTFGIFTEWEGTSVANQWIKTPYRGTWIVRARSIQNLKVTGVPSIKEGDELYPINFLPKDITCKDFLMGVVKMFNLHIESDRDTEKLYRIEPRDDFYKDGSTSDDFVDWSEIIDKTSMTIVPMGELAAKYYNFKYKEDSDYWPKKYKDDTNKVYGDYSKTIDNDFLSNDKSIMLPFATTVMINTPATTNIIIPQVITKDTNGVNKSTNSSTKFLYWGGKKPNSLSGVTKRWGLVSSVLETISATDSSVTSYPYYPYAGSCDEPVDPILDINWYYTDYVYFNKARWTNNNLYNKYWKNFIDEITDSHSKVVRYYAKLRPSDINKLDFSKIYVVNGIWYRLQKVSDYNAADEGITSVELLKIKSLTRFTPISTSDEIIAEYTDTSRMIDIKVQEIAPKSYLSRGAFSNYSQLESDSTKTNGQSNIVMPGSTNTTIQGNECYIGSDSHNISITGNGVFVSGGVTNVNVIGTNKIIINESDVTYINGIRYKNGVAISRANVINAGLNKVYDKKSSSTTPNVINGCEDEVIKGGSATYEDVINPGLDMILPNLQTYGITTLTNPNPRTNVSGAAIRPIGTTTLAEQIIEVINPRPYEAS